MSTQQVRIEAHQNEYLPEGGRVVDAILTVTMSGASPGAPAAPSAARGSAAEVIIVDVSTSMSGEKLVAARAAASAAVDSLRDGVSFAIVAGNHSAWSVFPGGPDLVVADDRSRRAARDAIKRLTTSGRTAIGTWLTLANQLFARRGADINHAILLTDGENLEDAHEFTRVLNQCAGRFVCDSRGVGRDWLARDLIRIAETLLGTAAGIKNPAELAADFRAMAEAAMGKTMADVALRVWTPAGSRIRFVKQMFPEIIDLTGRRTDKSPRIGEYPLGTWGEESREYHVCVEVEPNPVGEEVLAARISVVHQDEVLAQSLVRAVWTDDLAYSTKINRRVAHYSGEAELAEEIQAGLAARAAGDVERATSRLGRAVKLAHDTGREDTAKMLAKVVDVVDVDTGTVRLRSRSANTDVDIDAEMAAVGSRKTHRVRPGSGD